MIRALLVDDEQPARDRLRDMLAGFDGVEIVGEARDGEEALSRIRGCAPDLVFLDIEMPGRTGMEVAASLAPPRPRIVFCTAYDEHAIEAFEHHATDYLLKPVSRSRLARTLDRVRDAIEEQRRHHRELADATEAQARMFPHAPPRLARLDYAGVCRAARGVGGDYYDFIALDAERMALVLGDVSGKGLFAGLLMAALQARVQSLAAVHGRAPGELVGEVNRAMLAATASNRYATLFYGVWDDADRRLDYVNAGHNPPLLFRAEPAETESGRTQPGLVARRLEPNGTVVGALAEAAYATSTLRLRPGDLLVLYTDGVIEARRGGEEFGVARLEAAVRRHAARPAAELVAALADEVAGFGGEAAPHDDLTLVAARVR